MNCKKARVFISAAADGELSERDVRVLDGHLAACAECRRERRAISALRGQLGAWRTEEPSETLADSFMRRLAHEQETQAKGWRARMLPALPSFGFAAAAAAVLILAYFAGVAPRQAPVAGPKTNIARSQPTHVAPRLAEVAKVIVPEIAPVETPKATVQPRPVASHPRFRVAYLVRSLKRHFVPQRRMESPEEVQIAMALPTDAKEMSDSAKLEAVRRVTEKAARLQTLFAEANIKVEGAIIKPETQPVDAASDYGSKPDESRI
jgi:predicted anti-sigma-YlaC factor YlaD